MNDRTLTVRLDIAALAIPADVDLTTRQILNLTIIALRRTLQNYQAQQTQPLPVNLLIEGTGEKQASLKDLAATFTIGTEEAGE
jgi:hypothetical protein